MTDRTANILYYVLIAGIVACGVGSWFYLYFEYTGWPTWLTDLAPIPKATASVTVAGIELAATVTREDNFFTVAGMILAVLGTYLGIRTINFLFRNCRHK